MSTTEVTNRSLITIALYYKCIKYNKAGLQRFDKEHICGFVTVDNKIKEIKRWLIQSMLKFDVNLSLLTDLCTAVLFYWIICPLASYN